MNPPRHEATVFRLVMAIITATMITPITAPMIRMAAGSIRLSARF